MFESTQRGSDKASCYIRMVEVALQPFTKVNNIDLDIAVSHLGEGGVRKASTMKAYCHALRHFVKRLKVKGMLPFIEALRLDGELTGICGRFRQEALTQEWAVHVRDRGVFI